MTVLVLLLWGAVAWCAISVLAVLARGVSARRMRGYTVGVSFESPVVPRPVRVTAVSAKKPAAVQELNIEHQMMS